MKMFKRFIYSSSAVFLLMAAAPDTNKSGTILETMDASSYTYMKLKTDSGEIWAAVPQTKVKVGEKVTVLNPQTMDGFESKTLKRKFDHIMFGTLKEAAASAPSADAKEHHQNLPAETVDIAKIKVEKAKGPTGHTVAEIYAQKAELKKVHNQTQTGLRTDMQKKLKILIAEDDDSSGYLLRELLQNRSHSISHVKTGIEALHFCQNHRDTDLILMDIKMPKMNGLEAVMQIREFNKDIFIIAQTAHGLVSDRKKALDAGCNDYISKPINQNLLMEIINKYLYVDQG